MCQEECRLLQRHVSFSRPTKMAFESDPANGDAKWVPLQVPTGSVGYGRALSHGTRRLPAWKAILDPDKAYQVSCRSVRCMPATR
jgi:hypothetical protein